MCSSKFIRVFFFAIIVFWLAKYTILFWTNLEVSVKYCMIIINNHFRRFLFALSVFEECGRLCRRRNLRISLAYRRLRRIPIFGRNVRCFPRNLIKYLRLFWESSHGRAVIVLTKEKYLIIQSEREGGKLLSILRYIFYNGLSSELKVRFIKWFHW